MSQSHLFRNDWAFPIASCVAATPLSELQLERVRMVLENPFVLHLMLMVNLGLVLELVLENPIVLHLMLMVKLGLVPVN